MPYYEPGDVIQAEHTDARKLTLEQAKALTNWCDFQRCDLTDGVPLQQVLDLYHASSEWTSWQDWCEERPAEAVAAYNRCVKAKGKRLTVAA